MASAWSMHCVQSTEIAEVVGRQVRTRPVVPATPEDRATEMASALEEPSFLMGRRAVLELV